uniref:FGGY family carbohydrate kinase n=1 Tax=Oceaniglobus roseus TaxID=1737570 RepID=UPI000C7EDFB4
MTPATVAVLDIGKTNIKLSACTETGAVAETQSFPNATLPGPPWRHHDLAGQSAWLFSALADLATRHPLAHVIASGHGVGALLVTDDPDRDEGAALPMPDYEQPVPEDVNAAYAPEVADFLDRGSAILQGATHIARQMLWAEMEQPAGFARARHILGLPQYWAWRLSGRPVAEVSHVGAQSHLWNVPRRRWSAIVQGRGWEQLMPPLTPAWEDLGPIRPDLARRHGLPETLRIHAGLHDSSANFFRYQAAGLREFVLVSTGTWIVAMADGIAPERIDPARGMTLNADVFGNPAGGALCMGGRDFAAVAGDQPAGACADLDAVARLVARGSFARPSFADNDGQFPG